MSSPAEETDGRRARGLDTREQILDAAASLIGRVGYAAASTRAVAAAADVPLSLVHYHFGSRAGLLVAVLERENERLLERQRDLFAGPGSLADRWRAAAAYFEEDFDSGYVRVLWELWAAGLSDPDLAERWRTALNAWRDLIAETLARWELESGRSLPLPTGTIANLVAIVYLGIEVDLLADHAGDLEPHRRLLTQIGDLIERYETG